MGDWTFFSNYGHVLVCLAKNHDARLRDVAVDVGITERAVQKIVRDLQDADIVTVTKQGRCNRYRVNKRKSLRHQLEAKCTVGQLLALVSKPGRPLRDTELQEERKGDEKKPETEAGVSAPAEVETTKPIDTREQGSLF